MSGIYKKLVSGADYISTRMRKKRFGHFLDFVQGKSDYNILDVGGTDAYWNSMDFINRNTGRGCCNDLYSKVDGIKHDY